MTVAAEVKSRPSGVWDAAASQKRRWDRENRARCRCGGPVTRGAGLCRICENIERAQLKARKWNEIRDLWLAGLTLVEIGEHLGKAWAGVS